MRKLTLLITVLMTSVAANAQVTNGLVSSYTFNNGNANDEVGTNNGITNGATLTTDRFGNTDYAYEFEGDTSFIDCGHFNFLDNVSQYSISVWLDVNGIPSGGGRSVFSYQDSNVYWNHFLQARMWSNGSFYAYTSPVTIQDHWVGTPYSIADTTGWFHYTLTYDSAEVLTSEKYKTYINGQRLTVSSTQFNLNPPQIGGGARLFIGKDAWYSFVSNNWNGKIDDFRIYNRVLDSLEVDTLLNLPNPITVSIKERIEVVNVSLYPNPTSSKLTINTDEKIISIKVLDITGKIQNVQINNKQLKVSTLKNGIYFVHMQTDKGLLVSKFIKKQKYK